MYSRTLLDHFQNPRNAGRVDHPTAEVEVTNPVCGDLLQLTAQISDGLIREIRFLCKGCAAAIAAASVLTERLEGQPISAATNISADAIAAALDSLPEASHHAAHLAADAAHSLALRAATSAQRPATSRGSQDASS